MLEALFRISLNMGVEVGIEMTIILYRFISENEHLFSESVVKSAAILAEEIIKLEEKLI